MKKFDNLDLNQQLCLIAILIEYFSEGFEYTYNGIKKVFKPSDINFNNSYEVSRVLYIMSNFIMNKKSYDVTPKLETLNKNEKIREYLEYFKKNDFIKKIDILIYVFKFLSNNKELKRLNFIDEISENYTFNDLSSDIVKYKEKFLNKKQ